MGDISATAIIKRQISAVATVKKIITATALIACTATGQQSFNNIDSILLDGVDERVILDNLLPDLRCTIHGLWTMRVKPQSAITLGKYITFSNTTNAQFILIDQLANGKLRAAARSVGQVDWEVTTDSSVLTADTYNHVALFFDGAEASIFIDGVKPAQTFTVDVNRNIWFNDLTLDNGRIGSLSFNSLGDASFYKGNIDEVRFWNLIPVTSDVTNDFNSGTPKAPNLKRLVSNFTFDDSRDNFDTDVANEWRFFDETGDLTADSVNMEFADKESDV